MKMAKKSVAMIMLLAIVTASFAACSPKQEGTDTPTPTASASATDTPSGPSERQTISVLGVDWGYGPVSNSDMEVYWENLFDVNLDIEWVNYQDYHQKANVLIASGSQPDVTQIYKMDSSYYYPIFAQAIDAGQFVDMTSYLFNNGQGVAETNAVMKNWESKMWEQSTYNGGIYILPRSKAEIAQQSGVNYRKDLAKKYGFEQEPATMEELKTWLIDLSNAATAGEGQKIYALDFFGEDFMQDRVKAFAVAFTGQMDWGINAAGEFTYMQFADGYLDFLKWMKDLYSAGVLDPEFALGNADTSKFKAGRSVAYLNAWYNWNQSADLVTNKIFDKGTPDTYEAWNLAPVQGPKSIVISANAYDVDAAIAISSKCSEEKILKIMEVFNGTEEAVPGYNMLLSNGVEGVHYKLLEDGTVDTSDEEMGKKRTEGYVGAWNQIFLKTDADQVTDKFMRSGARSASAEAIAWAGELKNIYAEYLASNDLSHKNTNLISETYNNTWSTLTSDVNSTATLFVMGEVGEKEWNELVDRIVNSAEYKAIQAEYKAAAAK